MQVGSSPLTRGIHQNPQQKSVYTRFIPAHAGNTLYSLLLVRHDSVHPRSRGEYAIFINWAGISFGSSPLTRGIRRILPRK